VFTDAALVVSPAWVGDMVMAQSLLRLLKQRQPTTAIDVLVPAWSESLFKRMPEVRHIWGHHWAHGQLGWQPRYQLGRALRQQNYQKAWILPNSWKSALVPFWARIPQRTGYVGEWRYGLLNDVRQPNPLTLRRTVDQYVALGLPPQSTQRVPLLPPQLSPGQVHYPLSRLHLQPSQQPLLILCPGADYGPAKQWPLEYFAIVAKHQLAQGWHVWILGSEANASIGARIWALTQEKSVNLCGQTTLGEAVDILSLATAVISNDSGLMHIAAALNKPLIALYGASDPSKTPPLNQHAHIMYLGLSCSPCFQRHCPLKHFKCLRDLKAHQVIDTLESII